jgi:uroporphyrinogen-III synthase
VREVVAYEVEVGRRVPRRELSYLLKARAVLATSPSALDALRAAVGRPTFERLRRDLPLLVLGPRSLSRGRELGFRRVRAITPPFEKAINALLAQPKADAS